MKVSEFQKLKVGDEIRVKNTDPTKGYNYWTVADVRDQCVIGGVNYGGPDITLVANWDTTIVQYVHWGDMVSVERMELVAV